MSLIDSWTCLMVDKGPGVLDESVRTALKAAACNLHHQRVERTKISLGLCEGIIQTEWKCATIGSRSGVIFKAHLEQDSGDYFVNFLLNTEDLENGARKIREMEERGQHVWAKEFGRLSVPELYEFSDLRRHKLN